MSRTLHFLARLRRTPALRVAKRLLNDPKESIHIRFGTSRKEQLIRLSIRRSAAAELNSPQLVNLDRIAEFILHCSNGFNLTTGALASFTDHTLPAGFAPFNVQDINGQLYVIFAATNGGPGGYVDIFQENGAFVITLISGSPLNQPWGLAVAPANFRPVEQHLTSGQQYRYGKHHQQMRTSRCRHPLCYWQNRPHKSYCLCLSSTPQKVRRYDHC